MAFIKVGNKILKFDGKVVTNDPNPLKLPPFTIRCKFSSGYTPTMGDSQSLVDATENVWDITKNSTDWQALFKDNTSLIAVLGANTTSVTTMLRLFANCTSLTRVCSPFDLNTVTSVQNLFLNCTALSYIPTLDTKNVKNFIQMFKNCTSLTSIPPLDVRNVGAKSSSSGEGFANMFIGCTGITSVKLLHANTLAVTDIQGMFSLCESLIDVPLFDTSHVTNMRLMFNGCAALHTIPEFDTSNATDMGGLFQNCTSLTSISFGILHFYACQQFIETHSCLLLYHFPEVILAESEIFCKLIH